VFDGLNNKKSARSEIHPRAFRRASDAVREAECGAGARMSGVVSGRAVVRIIDTEPDVAHHRTGASFPTAVRSMTTGSFFHTHCNFLLLLALYLHCDFSSQFIVFF
jgi:hypothetical protein